jgi:hypothetical protein
LVPGAVEVVWLVLTSVVAAELCAKLKRGLKLEDAVVPGAEAVPAILVLIDTGVEILCGFMLGLDKVETSGDSLLSPVDGTTAGVLLEG